MVYAIGSLSAPACVELEERRKGERVMVQSEHILTRRLYEAVTQHSILEQPEIEHLQTCDECLELVRVLVRHHIQKSKGTGQ
jgi:hypothetical protein